MSNYGKSMLFLGEQWLGSNARSLAMGFRKAGWLVDVLDPIHYIPWATSIASRIANRVFAPLYHANFNNAIKSETQNINHSVVFVYKGVAVHPKTLDFIHTNEKKVALYFPDFSLQAHGTEILQCIAKYDQIFTAKSFGISDVMKLGAKEAYFINHACDTDVHRPIEGLAKKIGWQCDVAFIGSWSPHKEALLANLVERLPSLKLRIWGNGWNKNSSSALSSCIARKAVTGDFYAATIGTTKINLGLLSEQRFDSTSGDMTTARTFEIPGCGSFMLHERTDEVLNCFEEEREIECFADVDEMADKVRYYLDHEAERRAIAEAGYQRCMREHTYEHRALAISEHLDALLASR